jgi:hypothetical protein
MKFKDFYKELQQDRKLMVAKLKWVCQECRCHMEHHNEPIKPMDHVAAVRQRIEVLAMQEKLHMMSAKIISEFPDVFSPIPHIDSLPTDVYCCIKLKDPNKLIHTCSYSTLHKYCKAWETLIQQHLDAGRICPSNSAHASPAFMVPKTDPSILPCWVNDYRELNANTVLDAHSLPRVDDILSDCTKGKIWSKMDMTNSFFQTRVHPDDIHLTAIMMPLGLYEWLAMPMGLQNVPPIHQCCMMAALHKYIGKFCHIYMDDIVIWSDSMPNTYASFSQPCRNIAYT